MTTMLDARFAALRGNGHTGATSDMLLQWLQAGGATSGALPVAWREFLDAQGYSDMPHFNDAWKRYLRDRGHVGNLNDAQLTYWLDGGELTLTRYVGQSFGDSIADGSVVPSSEGYGENIGSHIAYDYTLNKATFPYLNTTQIRDLLFDPFFNPGGGNFSIIQGGVNNIHPAVSDPVATIQADITYMVDKALAAGHRVILIGVAPWKGFTEAWDSTKQGYTDTYNAWAASTYPDQYFDVYSLLEDPGEADTLLPAYDSGDGLHISAAAYAAVDAALAAFFDGVIP